MCLNRYYILMTDGMVFEKHSQTRYDAVLDVYHDHYNDVPYEDFINEVDCVEWGEDNYWLIKNYKTNQIETNSASKLKPFLNLKKLTKKPLDEEYDEFYGE